MAENQNFRAAFNGFNREDVVNYIAYLTNMHEIALNQLKTELEEVTKERDELRDRIEQVSAAEAECGIWKENHATLQEENARLQHLLEEQEQTIAQLQQDLQSVGQPLSACDDGLDRKEEELRAYRRAESAERRALGRVNQMYDRATGVLGDVNALMDETTERITTLTGRLNADLAELQAAISDSENTMTTAASMIGAIRPQMDEE